MATCIETESEQSEGGTAFTPPRKVSVWGLPFAAVTLEETLGAIGQMIADRVPRMIVTANLNYAMLSVQRDDLAEINRDAALILADGQPIVWRSRCGGETPLPERVAGSELIYRLGERSADAGWKLYLLGASPGVAQKCADGLCALYPDCQIVGVDSPPFRELSDTELDEQIARIRQAEPDILLVAFGQPKGEHWIHEHLASLQVPVSIQLGASFDFVAGTARRAPKWCQRSGFEWAYRMLCDPKRLVPRYAANAAFLMKMVSVESARAALGR